MGEHNSYATEEISALHDGGHVPTAGMTLFSGCGRPRPYLVNNYKFPVARRYSVSYILYCDCASI